MNGGIKLTRLQPCVEHAWVQWLAEAGNFGLLSDLTDLLSETPRHVGECAS